MDLLTKIIKTLPAESYENLLEKVGIQPQHPNYIIISKIREGGDMEGLNIALNLSKGAYNTHKSRLLKKVSHLVSKLEENTISKLKEETARLSQIALQNDREVSIRVLLDLEKKLKEYDLANELATIYKHLARLHRFYPEYEYYEMEYKRNVAYALTVTKAEDQLYDFIFHLSHFHLNRADTGKAEVSALLVRLDNTCKLYKSHRLFVIYNIAKIYHDCSLLPTDELAMQELNMESVWKELQVIFDKYAEDAFYNSLKHLIPFLLFEYYVKVGNKVKANHYLTAINTIIPRVANMQLWPFFINQVILSIVSKFVNDGNKELMFEFEETLYGCYLPNPQETPHFICHTRFRAMVAFYKGNYARAAKIINNLRNTISMKDYPTADVELKLFQAFQYALQNDPELAERLVASVKRQVNTDRVLKNLVKLFGKIISLILKHHHNGAEKENIKKYWHRFKEANNGKILQFIKLSLIDI